MSNWYWLRFWQFFHFNSSIWNPKRIYQTLSSQFFNPTIKHSIVRILWCTLCNWFRISKVLASIACLTQVGKPSVCLLGMGIWNLGSSYRKRLNEYVTTIQMKWVRDSEYGTTSAIWDHLNIFVIMCKLHHVRTCSKWQCNAEAKLYWALLQCCFAGLENIWRLI